MARLIFALVLSCLMPCCLAILPAQAGPDPVATLMAIYKPYLVKDGETPNSTDPQFYSARRKAQIKAVWETCAEGDDCTPGFDIFINGQDYDVSKLNIKQISATESRATVAVQFRNMNYDDKFTFTLVKENGAWLIDQLKGGSRETHYDLDELLKQEK